MSETVLAELFKHNNWANLQIVHACSMLSDEQLDAEPQTMTKGSIRGTLQHLVSAQEDYLSQLLGVEARLNWQTSPSFAELSEAASSTGEGLIALARNEADEVLQTKFQKDGYSVEPWVVMVQAINHATEHREQIKSMFSSLRLTPPRIDGWAFGRANQALIELNR